MSPAYFFLEPAGFLAIVFLTAGFLAAAGFFAAAGFLAGAFAATGFSAGTFSRSVMTSATSPVRMRDLAWSNAVSPCCRRGGSGGRGWMRPPPREKAGAVGGAERRCVAYA